MRPYEFMDYLIDLFDFIDYFGSWFCMIPENHDISVYHFCEVPVVECCAVIANHCLGFALNHSKMACILGKMFSPIPKV